MLLVLLMYVVKIMPVDRDLLGKVRMMSKAEYPSMGAVDKAKSVKPYHPNIKLGENAYPYFLKVDTVGYTAYDWQWNPGPYNKRIVYDRKNGWIHVLWMRGFESPPSYPDRKMTWNYYNPEEGSWVYGGGVDTSAGIKIFGAKNGYGDIEVDTAGLTVVSAHVKQDGYYQSGVAINLWPGSNIFDEHYTKSPGTEYIWPCIAVDGYNNLVLTATLYAQNPPKPTLYTWANVDLLMGGGGFIDWIEMGEYPYILGGAFPCARKDTCVMALVYAGCDTALDPYNVHVYYQISNDGGLTWGDKVDITNKMKGGKGTYTLKGFINAFDGDVYAMFDSEGYLHVLFIGKPASSLPDVGRYYVSVWSSVLWHYYEKTDSVYMVAYNFAPSRELPWSFGIYPFYWGNIIHHFALVEDPGTHTLYCFWIEPPFHQYGFQGSDTVAIGEIYFAFSTDMGRTWSPKFNISNTPELSEWFLSACWSESENKPYILFQQDLDPLRDIDPSEDGYNYTVNPVVVGQVGDLPVIGEGEIVEKHVEGLLPNDTIDTVIMPFTSLDTVKLYNYALHFVDTTDFGVPIVPKVMYKNAGDRPLKFTARAEIIFTGFFIYHDTLYIYPSIDSISPERKDTLIEPLWMYSSERLVELLPGESVVVAFDTFMIPEAETAIWRGTGLKVLTTFTEDSLVLALTGKKKAIELEEKKVAIDKRIEVYPNPASYFVNIRLLPAGKGNVKVAIYDIAGRKIRTLFDGMLTGEKILRWDGKDSKGVMVPSGIYFIKVQSGRNVCLSKIIWMR